MTSLPPNQSGELNSAPAGRWKIWRWSVRILVPLILMGVAARLALPSYLRDYVNGVLDRSPEYDGRVGKIRVSLWRGAYSIADVQIVKTTHAVPVPFFEAERVDFSLDWNALVHGQARGKVTMERPRINFVDGPTDEESQTGVDEKWLEMLEDLYPFRLDKAEVIQGELHFRAFHTSPPVDVYLSQVEGVITNLTNVADSLDPLIAQVIAKGVAMDSAQFDFEMSMDPQAYRPTFELATRVLDLDVTRLNALSSAYGDFDFERGSFDLVVELSAHDGLVDGYAKPLFRDLKVLSRRDVENDDPLRLFWEALVGLVGEIFKNQSRDQFGTRITLKGELDNPQVSILEVVGNVLHNAFVRAYLPKPEGRVDTGSSESTE